MKRAGWEWANSNRKRAIKIMWDTQGRDLDYVCDLIAKECGIDEVAARALYRKTARDELIAEGFVPAPSKVGRPRKDGNDPIPRAIAKAAAPVEAPAVINVPEPEPERTATGEKKSIADMKAYLEILKNKAGG